MFELPSAMAAAAPTFYILLVSLVFILSAAWAVKFSEDDPAGERYFAYLAAMMSVLAVLLVSMGLRALGFGWTEGDLPTVQAYGRIWTFVWAIGSLMLAGRLTIGWLGTLLICRDARPLEDKEMWRLVEFCRKELRVSVRPRVLVSDRLISPFVTGTLRPTIVLTPAVTKADPRSQRLIMLHEFAHLRRHDCLSELLLQVLGVFMWWNPLYWIARHKMLVLREVACDEMVVSRTSHKVVYMVLVASLAKLRPALVGQSFSTVHMASSSTLVQRMQELEGGLRVYPRYLPASLPQQLSRRGLVVWLIAAVAFCVVADQWGSEFSEALAESAQEPFLE